MANCFIHQEAIPILNLSNTLGFQWKQVCLKVLGLHNQNLINFRINNQLAIIHRNSLRLKQSQQKQRFEQEFSNSMKLSVCLALCFSFIIVVNSQYQTPSKLTFIQIRQDLYQLFLNILSNLSERISMPSMCLQRSASLLPEILFKMLGYESLYRIDINYTHLIDSLFRIFLLLKQPHFIEFLKMLFFSIYLCSYHKITNQSFLLKPDVECQPYFQLKSLGSSVVCTRITGMTDPSYNSTNDNNCANGYYLDSTTNSCFSCNFPNCQSCSSYMECDQCNDRFYPFNISVVDDSADLLRIIPACLACSPNCTACTSYMQCTNCTPGNYLSQNQCIRCSMVYCYKCTDSNTCTGCVGGTYLNNSQCSLCSQNIPNCLDCNISTSNNLICSSCASGYYLNGSFCSQCPANCQTCSPSGNTLTCSNCSQNYFLNGAGQCVQCQTNCLACNLTQVNNTNEQNCTLCAYGYGIIYSNTTNLTSCVQCTFPCNICGSNATNMTNSTNSTVCQGCETGFYMNLNSVDSKGNNLTIGQCYFCGIENCLSCSDPKTCTLCKDGYYVTYAINLASYICSPCPSQCMLCKKKFNSNVTNTPACIVCLPGSTLSSQGLCVPCKATGCVSCNSSNTSSCIECAPGYNLDSGQCTNCNISNCFTCNQGINPETNQTQYNCGQCMSGYVTIAQSDSSIDCAACPLNCLTCSTVQNCIECNVSYYLTYPNQQPVCTPCPSQCLTCNSNGCLYCAEGYYPTQTGQESTPQNVQCLPCSVIAGCVSCYNSQFCKMCTTDSYSVLPSIQGSCNPCPSGCILCDNNQKCSNCTNGYLLIKQSNLCLDEKGIPFWAMFITFALGSAFIFVAFEISCRVIKRKCLSKKELNQTEMEEQNIEKPMILMQTGEKRQQSPSNHKIQQILSNRHQID